LNRLVALCLVGIVGAGAPALAQDAGGDAPVRGVEVALGVGYGSPLGGYGETTGFKTNTSLDYWITGQVPISVELGYRIDRRFVVGLSGQYGFAFVNKDHTLPCDEGVSCSASVIRIDAGIIWNIVPGAKVAPWIGLGAGYEWAHISQEGLIVSSWTSKGPEYANLRVGADLAVAPGFRVGPFFSLSFGRYESESGFGESVAAASTFTTTRVHEWFVAGTRGTYDLHF
jgi:hypothetical protein